MALCYARRAARSVSIHNSACMCYDIPRLASSRFVDRRRRPHPSSLSLPTRPRARTLRSCWPTQRRRTYSTWTPRRAPSLALALYTYVRRSRSRRTRVSRMLARPRARPLPLSEHSTQSAAFTLCTPRVSLKHRDYWSLMFVWLNKYWMYPRYSMASLFCSLLYSTWVLFLIVCSPDFSCFLSGLFLNYKYTYLVFIWYCCTLVLVDPSTSILVSTHGMYEYIVYRYMYCTTVNLYWIFILFLKRMLSLSCSLTKQIMHINIYKWFDVCFQPHWILVFFMSRILIVMRSNSELFKRVTYFLSNVCFSMLYLSLTSRLYSLCFTLLLTSIQFIFGINLTFRCKSSTKFN